MVDYVDLFVYVLHMYCICILYISVLKDSKPAGRFVWGGCRRCRGSFVAGMGIPMAPVMPPSPMTPWMSPSQAEEKEHLEAWR